MAAMSSYLSSGNVSKEWASIYSILFEPQVLQKFYQDAGKGFDIMDFVRCAENEIKVKNRTVTALTGKAPEKVITLGDSGGGVGIATGAAGADITFVLASTDYDSSGNCILRVGDDIVIPPEYLPTSINVPRVYRVMSNDGAAAPNTEWTAKPWLKDGTTYTASQISTQVDSGTELMIGGDSYALGSGQPDGTSEGAYSRTFTTRISKESLGFEGGVLAYQEYIPVQKKGGGKGLFNRSLVRSEFLLDRKMDANILLGEDNDNTTMTGTSQFNGTQAIPSTRGILPHMDLLAQEYSYVGTLERTDFDNIKPLLQSQGVADTDVSFLYGPNIGLQVERAIKEDVKEYSGGAVLAKNMENIGVRFQSYTSNNITFILKELASFSNPNRYGSLQYFKDMGMIIPQSKAKVQIGSENKPISLGNLTIGYLANNEEDRTRIIRSVDQMSGRDKQAVGQYDGSNVWMLSEYMVIFNEVNQMILVNKTT